MVVLSMLGALAAPATGQLSTGIGFPGVSIGINIPVYPEFARIPGCPVYDAPQVQANFFFYDGLYWVYQDDDWPESVPLFVLRIPVRCYRRPGARPRPEIRCRPTGPANRARTARSSRQTRDGCGADGRAHATSALDVADRRGNPQDPVRRP
jgi:hypothetical protein